MSHPQNYGCFHKTGPANQRPKINPLTLVQCLEFIGADLDSLQVRALLPQYSFHSLSALIETVQTSPQMLARHCIQLVGHMAAGTFVISHSRLHMRCLQSWFSLIYWLNKNRLDKPLLMPSRVKLSLDWWKDPENICIGVPFTQPSP